MAHPLFGPEVKLMLAENDVAAMKAFCEDLHPATVAETLAEDLDVNQCWQFLQQTSIKHQAAIFEYFPIEWQVRMVQESGRQHVARLIEQMSHDDRVDLLRRLQPRVVEELLRLVDEADRRDIAMLGKYAENTAGALMTTDYAWLPENVTVGEALDRLRLQAPDRETIYYVYVLDDQRRLLGVVSLRDLILAPRHALVRNVMERDVISVKASDDREKVAQELARFDLLAICVVDDEGRLLGIVTHDDAIDVVVQEATEDAQRMGAVGTFTVNYLDARFVTIWRKRAIWLACLFGAELFTFTALSYFEDALKAIVVLAMFVPLCLSTGGNSGSQAATLITRAMALGQIAVSDWRRVIFHELFMGIALGLTLGTIGFFRVAVTPHGVLNSVEHVPDGLSVRVPRGASLAADEKHRVPLPADAFQFVPMPKGAVVTLPPDQPLPQPARETPEFVDYDLPRDSVLSYEIVNRWDLAVVIALAVTGICLWGTMVGSILPLVFRALGFDPAFASSPFVATFVDVTGIVIYFSTAILIIPGLR